MSHLIAEAEGTLEILSRDKSPDRLRASRRTGIEYQSSFYFCETAENEKGSRSCRCAKVCSRTKVNAGATRTTWDIRQTCFHHLVQVTPRVRDLVTHRVPRISVVEIMASSAPACSTKHATNSEIEINWTWEISMSLYEFYESWVTIYKNYERVNWANLLWKVDASL